MSKAEKATAVFKEGFSCSQAVLSAYAQDFGLDQTTSLKISQVFGGGMARTGETCGAVTGALLVISLKYGRTKAEDIAARDKTYALAREFMRKFTSRHGSVQCKTLLGCDISSEEGLKFAHDQGLTESRCPQFIRTATEILDEIL